MTILYIDADACPVKDEALGVAARHGIETVLVTDGGIRPPRGVNARLIIVPPGPDAADDWIADHIALGDVCITNDIPLAARCLEKGARAVKPNGQAFTQDGIGMALANRELMQHLRERGEITGGPRSFSKADRSAFLNGLETALQAAMREITGKK